MMRGTSMNKHIRLIDGTYRDFNDVENWPAFSADTIAHALSQQCRFNGNSPRFYSVATHSVLVSHLVPEECAMAALFHDAAEAFIGDMNTHLKGKCDAYVELEEQILARIYLQFGILEQYYKNTSEIYGADKLALVMEKHYVLECSDIWPGLEEYDKQLTEYKDIKNLIGGILKHYEYERPKSAKRLFMKRFIHLLHESVRDKFGVFDEQ